MSDAAAASQSGTIIVRCTCGKKVGAPPHAAGKAVKCPRCGQRVPIPRSGASTSPGARPLPPTGRADASSKSAARSAAGTDGRIKVVCTCGKKIRVPASGAGKKGKCPACGAFFRVPSLKQKAKPPVLTRDDDRSRPSLLDDQPEPSSTLDLLADEPSDDLGGGLFSELEVQSATGAKSPGAVSAIRCPHCHGMIPANSVRCPLCDNNPAKPPKAKQKREAAGGSWSDKLSGAGSALAALSLGTLFSCIGAAIGIALWVAVAMAIQLELGYIAWILGGLTGFGMILGTKSQSVIAGCMASVIALVAIIVAKIAVVFLVLFPLLMQQAQANSQAGGGQAAGDAMTEIRRELINDMTVEELEARGYDPFGRKTKRYYEEMATVNAANREKVDAWTDEEVRAEIERREADAVREMEEFSENWRRSALASDLAEKELETGGVDPDSDGYFDRLDELQDQKLKEIETWSADRFEEEYEKYEAGQEALERRSDLADYMAADELEERGIEDHMPSYYQKYEEIHAANMAELESWTDERVATELERRETQAAQEFADSAPGLGDVPGSEWAMLAMLFFGPMGIFITLIAMGTAFWVGYGGFQQV